MGLQVFIRAVNEDDLVVLEEQLNNGPKTKHQTRFERQRQGEVTYLIALVNDMPVGHVLIKWSGTQDESVSNHIKNCPDFEDLLVKDTYRRNGIGKQLLLHGEALAKQKGFRQVGLGVGTENESAKMLYQKMGYKDSGLGEYTIGGSYIDESGALLSWTENCVYLIHKLTD
ncbi:GNAT family N-acetyltransferase [Paenibacillus sp. FSL W8-0187]|uniref:GNAT family N-acetyltransferase n=1 Tax=Paenibacillus sp. FSL W8-0187 TaxID=2921710 RepID=UPI0030D8C863